MKDSKDEFYERKMKMWKMREELLNSMNEKELRAFMKGYMMGQKTVFRQLSAIYGCEAGGCHESSSCKTESCGCGSKDCNCGKE